MNVKRTQLHSSFHVPYKEEMMFIFKLQEIYFIHFRCWEYFQCAKLYGMIEELICSSIIYCSLEEYQNCYYNDCFGCNKVLKGSLVIIHCILYKIHVQHNMHVPFHPHRKTKANTLLFSVTNVSLLCVFDLIL